MLKLNMRKSLLFDFISLSVWPYRDIDIETFFFIESKIDVIMYLGNFFCHFLSII